MSGLNDGSRLCLSGRFELRAGERLLIDRRWRRARSKALLKLLGLQQEGALHREQVMELLWPHLEPAAAANQFYKSLTTSGPNSPGEGSRRRWSRRARSWSNSTTRCGSTSTSSAPARAAREQRDPALYEQALEVYAGDLLPEDVFEEWASGSHQYDQPHQPSFDRSAGRGRNRVERTIGRLKR